MNINQKYISISTLLFLITTELYSAPNTDVVFTINGMNCQGCVNKVNTALESCDGIETFNVNLVKGEAYIQFDSTKTNIKIIQSQLNTTPFSISEKSENDNSNQSFLDKLKSLFK